MSEVEHESLRTAFVIGPIGDKDADIGSSGRSLYEDSIQIFEEVIVPACRAFGVDPVRVDKFSRTGEITDQIFRFIRDADLVIADVTGANPNVMYELGARHTTGKLTIQIGERDRLPFDVSAIRTIFFKRSESGLIEARRRLSDAISVGMREGGDPVTITRIWNESSREIVSVAATSSDLDEPGYLESVAEAEEAITALPAVIGSIIGIMEEITELTRDSSEQIEKLNHNGGSAAQKLAIAERHASRLEDPAARMAEAVNDYRRSVHAVQAGLLYLVERARSDDTAESRDFLKIVERLSTSAKESIEGVESFLIALQEGEKSARSVRRINRTMSATLREYIATSEVVGGWREAIVKH
jgi:hypothetical protein